MSGVQQMGTASKGWQETYNLAEESGMFRS